MSRNAAIASTPQGAPLQALPLPDRVFVQALVADTWRRLEITDACDLVEIVIPAGAQVFAAWSHQDGVTGIAQDAALTTAHRAASWAMRPDSIHIRACDRPDGTDIYLAADGAAVSIRVGEYAARRGL